MAASYFFHLNWQPIYGLLLLATTAVTYAGGKLIERCENPTGRKWLLAFSCFVPLGLLGCYKYAPFFNRTVLARPEHAVLFKDEMHLNHKVPNIIQFDHHQHIAFDDPDQMID